IVLYPCFQIPLNPLQCTSGIKIIHGDEAKPHSRPYMAALYVGEEKRFICGGFLVKPRYILTAAHCNLGRITAHLGVHNRTKKERTLQVIPVKEIIPHEQFNTRINANDIMLLKLQRKARVTRAVNTISILKSGASIRKDAPCFVAGWGHIGSRGPSSDVLREVEVKISQTCKTRTQICAKGTGLKGACHGDSGGPLVCLDRRHIPRAVGILSYGADNCEDPRFSNIYTNVSAYWDWIQKKIKS
uniref:trypsin n=1 Tax=Erpetoichthys calabaricus TaxID=27687 RepID=A0A8C4TE00_ERPCA